MGKFGMDSMMLYLIFFACIGAVCSLPTCEEYTQKICPQGTFKCAPYATCCQKKSEMCSSLSRTCEDVFAPGEDRNYVCCNALSTNDTTREGLIELNRSLIEACIYRLGSETWPEYCEAKYHGEPQDEQSSTVAETNPTTMVPTDSVFREPSSFKEEHCVWQSMLGCALTLIVCVVFARKTLWVRDKCRQILCSVFGECQVCHSCQHGDTTSIEISQPTNKLKTPKNLQAFGNEPNLMNVHRREGRVAPKIRRGAPVTDQPAMNGEDLVLHRGLVALAKPDYSTEEAANLLDQSSTSSTDQSTKL